METVEVPRIVPVPGYGGPGIASYPDTVLSPEQVPVMPTPGTNDNASGGSGFWGSPYQTMELPRLTANPDYPSEEDAFFGGENTFDDWFGEGTSDAIATVAAGASGFFFPWFWTGYNIGNWIGLVPDVSGPVLLGSSVGVASRGIVEAIRGGGGVLSDIRKGIERTSYGLYGAAVGAAAAAARASRYGAWTAIAAAFVGGYVGYYGGTWTYDMIDDLSPAARWILDRFEPGAVGH